MRGFKIHESCNRCVYVTVSGDTTFIAEARVKVIAGDLEGVRGRLTDSWVSERRKRFGEEVARWASTEEKLE